MVLQCQSHKQETIRVILVLSGVVVPLVL
jgi:hypothetical protein